MIANIPSAVVIGVEGTPVAIEVHVSNGLPGFTIVGLPDAAVRESRDRVRAALLSSGLPWPRRRATVNLAPSGVRKCGSGLDLPIAIGVLVACGELPVAAVASMAFVGELGLDGSLRGVPGMVVLADALRHHRLVVPEVCWSEARAACGAEVAGACTLGELVDKLRGRRPWGTPPRVPPPVGAGGVAAGGRCAGDGGAHTNGVGETLPPLGFGGTRSGAGRDLADVKGQRMARRALEAAATGAHHVLLVGPPGAGKTMLANRLVDLLPALSRQGSLEVTRIHSVAGEALPPPGAIARPPFRAPHHSVSPVAMIGGGAPGMRPGEISLAHEGVLFLDEMGEFPTQVLDTLRQPLEEGRVRVSRSRGTADFPARFLLVGATNPCPCGEGGAPGTCRCSPTSRERYVRRLSAPLLDRFDIAVRVDRPETEALVGTSNEETTATVASRVGAARAWAQRRGVENNALLPADRLEDAAPLEPAALELLERSLRSGALSARGFHRIRRLALTLADLDRDPPDPPGGAADPERSGHGPLVTEAAVPLSADHVREALYLRGSRELLLGSVAS